MAKFQTDHDILAGVAFLAYAPLFDDSGTEVTTGTVQYALVALPKGQQIVGAKVSSYNATEGGWQIQFTPAETEALLETDIDGRLVAHLCRLDVFVDSPYNVLLTTQLRVGKSYATETIS